MRVNFRGRSDDVQNNMPNNVPPSQSYNQQPSQPQFGTPYIPATKDWIIWLILMMIPIVNIILLIMWAVDKDPYNLVRSNFAKAQLIMTIIAIVLSVLFIALFWGTMMLTIGGSSY